MSKVISASATPPAPGNIQQLTGIHQHVSEVNRGWTSFDDSPIHSHPAGLPGKAENYATHKNM